MSKSKRAIVGSGYIYKCGCCGISSREHNREYGMKIWRRLHFKKNPECGKYDNKHGMSKSYNNDIVLVSGKLIKVDNARRGTSVFKKSSGHNKSRKKIHLSDEKLRNNYKKNAKKNPNFAQQIIKDKLLGTKD